MGFADARGIPPPPSRSIVFSGLQPQIQFKPLILKVHILKFLILKDFFS